MDTKIILLFIAIGLLSTSLAYPQTACGSGRTHDSIMGQRQAGDVLLYTSRQTMKGSAHGIRTRDIMWPIHDILDLIITRIEVLDQITDGKGGCASLTYGGVGNHSVRLRLETQTDGEFDFIIKIYGK